jgi:hypothetical protein
MLAVGGRVLPAYHPRRIVGAGRRGVIIRPALDTGLLQVTLPLGRGHRVFAQPETIGDPHLMRRPRVVKELFAFVGAHGELSRGDPGHLPAIRADDFLPLLCPGHLPGLCSRRRRRLLPGWWRRLRGRLLQRLRRGRRLLPLRRSAPSPHHEHNGHQHKHLPTPHGSSSLSYQAARTQSVCLLLLLHQSKDFATGVE